MKFSFFTVCMGRLHYLKEVLPHNLALAGKFSGDWEFIILDYNSQDGMEEWAKVALAPHIASGRVVYLREKTAKYFSLAHSKNIVLQMAAGDVIVNLDADNFIAPGYIQAVADEFSKNEPVFVTAPQVKVTHGEKDGTYGRIAIRTEFLRNSRGYDETFQGWGGEDWDIMDRSMTAGFRQVKLPMELIGSALPNTHDERFSKNYDPAIERVYSNQENIKRARSRKKGAPLNPHGYGKATVYKNFHDAPIELGVPACVEDQPPPPAENRSGPWRGKSDRKILATILDYHDRPGILMSKAWLMRAKMFCHDWDIVVCHFSEIEEIKKFADRLGGIRFQQLSMDGNAIKSELSGPWGSRAQDYKIPFLKHVHDDEWPPFVFVDGDAMIWGDISELARVVEDKPFVATSESFSIVNRALKVVNTGVFSYKPESRLLSYRRLYDEWIRCGRKIDLSTGEQGLIIPLLYREGYDWEHPAIGHEYNVLANAAILDGSAVRVMKEPPPGTVEWVADWFGWGLQKPAKIVHAISKYKWWTSAHLHDIWTLLVQGVYDVEAGKK